MSLLRTTIARLVPVMMLTTLLVSCAQAPDSAPAQPAGPPALRVGITPNYPPMIFMPGEGQVAGVEADLAQLLGQALGRPVEFVELLWEDQIPALLAGETDIIMSGMSITRARRIRITFSEPYLKTGLSALVRTEDAAKYSTAERILHSTARIGVVTGTTSDAFGRRNFPDVRVIGLPSGTDGPFQLKRGVIDVFIDDFPAIMWLASENEADLVASHFLFNEEDLGWGIRRDNTKLLNVANGMLRAWRADGTLANVLARWLPYVPQLE
jgi:polar amino acid transport system substrate-binding protein